jgi:hypothetical protein
MAQEIARPRKRRTRQHVIADLSVHHVEGFILEAGYTAQRLGSDYGYDLVMNTFDTAGYVEPASTYFQIKAMESLKAIGSDYVFDVDIRDYNLWINEDMLVILVLYDALRRRAVWLPVQPYFEADPRRRAKGGRKTVRVRVPRSQYVNDRAIARIRELKRLRSAQGRGEQP